MTGKTMVQESASVALKSRTKLEPKLYTNCFLIVGNKILLGMKKRGFGANRWNGFGGKVHEGETIEQAAIREMQEEAGVTATKIENRGVIIFEYSDNPELAPLEVHIFVAREYSGEPAESEEMRPQWFSTKKVPQDNMWADVKYWLSQMIGGKKVKAYFLFEGEQAIKEYKTEFF